MRPVTIIGGGLAGLATGIGLRRRGVPVVIHEAGAYPRHRVCGEFIAGLDDNTRDTLGLEPLLADAPRHKTLLWHKGNGAFGHSRLPKPAIGISRHALDARMAEAFVAAGGDLRVGSRLAFVPGTEGWLDATGRRPQAGGWVGMKFHATGIETRADLEFHLGRGAYVGMSAVESGEVNVCGLFRPPIAGKGAGVARLFGHLDACGLSNLADRLREASVVQGSFCSVAGLGFAPWPATRRGMRLGDAAGMIPPFTGDGMAIAFQSAVAALDPLFEYALGGINWRGAGARIAALARRRFSLRLGIAAILHPFLTRTVGQASVAVLHRAGLVPFGTVFRTLH